MHAVQISKSAFQRAHTNCRLQVQHENFIRIFFIYCSAQRLQLHIEHRFCTNQRKYDAKRVVLFFAPFYQFSVIFQNMFFRTTLDDVVSTTKEQNMFYVFRQAGHFQTSENVITAITANTVVKHFNFSMFFCFCNPRIVIIIGKTLNQGITKTSNVIHYEPYLFINDIRYIITNYYLYLQG